MTLGTEFIILLVVAGISGVFGLAANILGWSLRLNYARLERALDLLERDQRQDAAALEEWKRTYVGGYADLTARIQSLEGIIKQDLHDLRIKVEIINNQLPVVINRLDNIDRSLNHEPVKQTI